MKKVLVILLTISLTACGSAPASSVVETPTDAPTETPTEEATPTENPFALKKTDASLDELISVEDDFDGTIVYASKFDSELKDGTLRSTCLDLGFDPFRVFIVESDEEYSLLLQLNYYADDWLFARELEVKVEDDIVSVDLPYGLRDVLDNGSIKETYTIDIDGELLAALYRVTNQTDVSIRFVGDTKFTTELLTKKKMAIKQMLEVWDALS